MWCVKLLRIYFIFSYIFLLIFLKREGSREIKNVEILSLVIIQVALPKMYLLSTLFGLFVCCQCVSVWCECVCVLSVPKKDVS